MKEGRGIEYDEKSGNVVVEGIWDNGELIEVIKAGEKDLESIFAFEPPKLEAFYDKELRREFDTLTARLKSAKGARR